MIVRRAWSALALVSSVSASWLSPAFAANAPQQSIPAHEQTVSLRVQVVDAQGRPLWARVQVTAANNTGYPPMADAQLMSHTANGGVYCYPGPSDEIRIPPGNTRITVGRGFEWVADSRYHQVTRDTTIRITLARLCDLSAQGWWSGDLHAHTKHPPVQYDVSPQLARRIGEAEGLGVLELLDGWSRFTGLPDPVSDSTFVLQYSFEHRNQAYGHVVLPALRQGVTDVACEADEPAWPPLSELYRQVSAAQAPLFVLGHPHSTADYALDGPWPGAGLGRGLPLLAVAHQLDALDVVSYSNDPDCAWNEWYDLLGAGLPCVPTAGTDAVLDWWDHLPAGGWRVYANTGAGVPLDHARWLQAVRAGDTFVTNHPLVPRCRFNGVAPGGSFEAAGDSLDLVVEARAYEMAGLTRVSVIADGIEVWARPISNAWPGTRQWDSTFTVRMATPAWAALRVDGAAGSPHAFLAPGIAHTNAVMITRGGQFVRRTAACARWLAELDQLQRFVDARGRWSAPWQRDSVMAQIDRAREHMRAPFVHAPERFELLDPPSGAALAGPLRWSRAHDADAGDVIRYRVRVASDSLFSDFAVHWTTDTSLVVATPPGAANVWWSVEAVDWAGRQRTAESGPRMAHAIGWYAGVPPGAAASPRRALPNPSRGIVRLEGFGPSVQVLDVRGRVVASLGRGIQWAEGALRWDSRDAAPGVYWVRTRDRLPPVRVVHVR